MTNASQLSITQLASTINAHTGKAENYTDKAEQHFKSAGLHLIEAKKRIAAGEYEGGFVKFLGDECKALSSSRAYELIAIANGTKTVESVRADKAASMVRSRKAVRHVVETPPNTVPDMSGVHHVVDTPPKTVPDTSAVHHVVDIPPKTAQVMSLAERRELAHQEAAAIRQHPNYRECQEVPAESAIRAIEIACRTVSLEDLKHVLTFLRKGHLPDEQLAAQRRAEKHAWLMELRYAGRA